MFAVTRTLLVLGVVGLVAAAGVQAQRRDKNVITAEEIERAQPNVSTAYDAVQTLRPRWLQPHELSRLPGRPGDPLQSNQAHVYLNDHDVGDVDYLRSIPAVRVLELHWLSANEAASRFGPTDGQTAIVVTLKR